MNRGAVHRGIDDDRETWRRCSPRDRRKAVAFAQPMYGRRARAYVRSEIVMVRLLLQERWQNVEDLEGHLLLDRRLSGGQVKDLLEHAAR